MKNWIAAVARSPLLHFAIIGGAIYAAYVLLAPEPAEAPAERLTVSRGDVEWLETSWQKRWMRRPTPEERQGLIDQFVRETILYREAVAMGLDEDDTIIRRRLAQKLEFLFQDLADAREPTAEEIEAYFTEHRERYQAPDLLTFTHVFVNPDKRGDDTLADAEGIKARLQGQEDPTAGLEEVGDPFMLQRYYPERPETEVGKLFGREFASSIFELPAGEWQGPVLSGYGVHLVLVHDRQVAPPPELSLVKERVRQDVKDERRSDVNDQMYENLRSRYQVVVEEE